MSKIVRRVVTLFILVCFVCLTATGCCIQHKWVKATCTRPKHCSKCGKTEGKALGHNWDEATCDHPKTCSRCGATEGEKLEHVPGDLDINDDMTQAVSTCKLCGQSITIDLEGFDGHADTVGGYICAFNRGARNISTQMLNSSAIDDLNELSSIGELDYEQIEGDGTIPLSTGVSVVINPGSSHGINDDLESVTYIINTTDDLAGRELQFVSSLACYLYGFDRKFADQDIRDEIINHFRGDTHTNGEKKKLAGIGGYAFTDHSTIGEININVALA